MPDPLVLGVVGWSGSGKTTLLTKLLPLLTRRGLRVATLKHAHHDFDVDIPGKDSWEHRRAGAREVIVCSSRRWVQMHELAGETEPTLAGLLRHVSPCELILVEGYKRERHPKIEVHRPALGQPPLFANDPLILAVASDAPLPEPHPPRIELNDTAAVAAAVLGCARPLPEVLSLLTAPGRTPPQSC
jgi:molybdopterin-guanine dinucleotide biosynthesis adapter protein